MIKAVLFDMDGVLFDSMPYHAQAWYRTMCKHAIDCTPEDFFAMEGCTGSYTISQLYERNHRPFPSQEESEEIYRMKSTYFNSYPEPLPIDGAQELVRFVRKQGLQTVVVTGSGQLSLMDRLQATFNDAFPRERIVCASDVTNGKPHPEPFLKGLEKAGVAASEAIVIENAPMGVRAAKAANIFTVVANTGPLPDSALLNEGGDRIYPNLNAILADWETIVCKIK